MEELLGAIYVTCWSVSAYPIVWSNWKNGNPNAVSLDYVVLNTIGYMCLFASMVLQRIFWISGSSNNEEQLAAPEISNPDLTYCGHGLLMNLVLLSQFVFGQSLWNFSNTVRGQHRMNKFYQRIALFCSVTILILIGLFLNELTAVGMSNDILLSFCNKLSAIKIAMSLIKYFPQVKYNFERKTMRGFPIQSTIIDIVGSICSLGQLALKLAFRQR